MTYYSFQDVFSWTTKFASTDLGRSSLKQISQPSQDAERLFRTMRTSIRYIINAKLAEAPRTQKIGCQRMLSVIYSAPIRLGTRAHPNDTDTKMREERRNPPTMSCTCSRSPAIREITSEVRTKIARRRPARKEPPRKKATDSHYVYHSRVLNILPILF